MNAKVLFVDDDMRMLNSLRATFCNQYHVEVSNSADTALQLLNQQNFDVLICDERMPGTKGLEFLSEARRLWPNMARVLLASFIDMDQREEELQKADLFRYIQKPWNTQDLIQTIDDAYIISQETVHDYDSLQAMFSEQGNNPDAQPGSPVSSINKEVDLGFAEKIAAIGDLKRIENILGMSIKMDLTFKSPSEMLYKLPKDAFAAVVLIDLNTVSVAIAQWLDLVQSKFPDMVIVAIGKPSSQVIADSLSLHSCVFNLISDSISAEQAKSLLSDAMDYHLRLTLQNFTH